MAKETVKFLRDIDYARLRDFDLKILISHEISPTCFYLTKRGLIQKVNKFELMTELKSSIRKNIPTPLPPTNHHKNVIIDFMADIVFDVYKETASKQMSEDEEQQAKA